MSTQFLLHVCISGIIFYILASGQKLFLKIKGTLDFSYLATVIFATYAAVLFHIHFWADLFTSIWWAYLVSLVCTLFVLFLSSKLSDIYFAIGTLALYMISIQVVYNTDWLTWWAQWLSGFSRMVWNTSVYPLETYIRIVWGVWVVLLVMLFLFRKSYAYTILHGRWEASFITRSLGISITVWKFVLIMLTSLLAVVWWWLFAYYYLFIDPQSFWLWFLIVLLTISFLSYGANERWTLCIALLVVGGYEWLRFFKIVEVAKLGYMREIIFSLLIMAASFLVFRTTSFGRER